MKYSLFFLVQFFLLSCPTYLLAQSANFRYVSNVSNLVTYTFASITYLLVALALVWFIWGIVIFIKNADDEKGRGEGKQKIIWGIISLFVIISMWGLVALYQQLTNVSGNASGLTPPAIPSRGR